MAYWAIAGMGALWRRAVWERCGSFIAQVAVEGGVEPVPLRFGWRVETPEETLSWVGTVYGERTVVTRGARRAVFDEWLVGEALWERVSAMAPPQTNGAPTR